MAVSRPKFMTAPTTGDGPTGPPPRPDAADDGAVNDGHYWEFLDRAYVAGAYVDQFLGGHPVLKKEAALRAAYERAEEALAELYVRAGRLASEKDVQGAKDDPSDDDERG